MAAVCWHFGPKVNSVYHVISVSDDFTKEI